MDPYRAFNCEPRIKNRGGPGAVVKCNGFPWFSLALSARACLRSISLKFRMCSAALLATTWGLHDAKWRCSKNAFREDLDYLADCTIRDAMVVPPCFRLFASAPPPDRKAAPMRDVYLHRRYAWSVSPSAICLNYAAKLRARLVCGAPWCVCPAGALPMLLM